MPVECIAHYTSEKDTSPFLTQKTFQNVTMSR